MAATCTLCARSLGHDTAGVPACHACLRRVAQFLLTRSCDVLSRMWMTSAQSGALAGAEQGAVSAPEVKEWDAATKTWTAPGPDVHVPEQSMNFRSQRALTLCVMGNNDLGLASPPTPPCSKARPEPISRASCTIVFKQAMWPGAIDDAARRAVYRLTIFRTAGSRGRADPSTRDEPAVRRAAP